MKAVAFPSLAVFASFALTACPPPPNFLDGSIKTSHDLAFDTVEMRFLVDQSAYELTYYRALDETGTCGVAAEQQATQCDEVVEIVFTQAPEDIAVDTPIDITTADAASQIERTTAANDPFPTELDSATVTFFVAPVVGETVSGEFAITFANGRTLNGGFETTLVEASF